MQVIKDIPPYFFSLSKTAVSSLLVSLDSDTDATPHYRIIQHGGMNKAAVFIGYHILKLTSFVL